MISLASPGRAAYGMSSNLDAAGLHCPTHREAVAALRDGCARPEGVAPAVGFEPTTNRSQKTASAKFGGATASSRPIISAMTGWFDWAGLGAGVLRVPGSGGAVSPPGRSAAAGSRFHRIIHVGVTRRAGHELIAPGREEPCQREPQPDPGSPG